MVQITTGAQTLTAAGAVTPTTGADISAATKPATLQLTISNLSAASGIPRALIVFEETVTDFTAGTPLARLAFNVEGPIDSPSVKNWMMDEIPGLKAGVTSALLRAHVAELSGTSPTITLSAMLLP